jgi:hypothetical protein
VTQKTTAAIRQNDFGIMRQLYQQIRAALLPDIASVLGYCAMEAAT